MATRLMIHIPPPPPPVKAGKSQHRCPLAELPRNVNRIAVSKAGAKRRAQREAAARKLQYYWKLWKSNQGQDRCFDSLKDLPKVFEGQRQTQREAAARKLQYYWKLWKASKRQDCSDAPKDIPRVAGDLDIPTITIECCTLKAKRACTSGTVVRSVTITRSHSDGEVLRTASSRVRPRHWRFKRSNVLKLVRRAVKAAPSLYGFGGQKLPTCVLKSEVQPPPSPPSLSDHRRKVRSPPSSPQTSQPVALQTFPANSKNSTWRRVPVHEMVQLHGRAETAERNVGIGLELWQVMSDLGYSPRKATAAARPFLDNDETMLSDSPLVRAKLRRSITQ